MFWLFVQSVNQDALNQDALNQDALNQDALNQDALNQDALCNSLPLQPERSEEIVALVIDEDECREVLHTDFPDSLHSEFRELDAFDALDIVLCKDCSRASD